MNKLKLITAISLAGLLIAIPTQAKKGKSMSQDQTQVLATVSTMTEAFQSGDLSQVMGSYETDAAIAFEPGQTIFHGLSES